MGTATQGSIGTGPGRGPRFRSAGSPRRVPLGYAAAGALVLLHGAGSLTHWGGPAGPGAPADPGSAPAEVIGDAALAVAAGLAALACGARAAVLARRRGPAGPGRWSWLLAGLSCLAAAVGNGVWAYDELARDASPPQGSAADWAFLFFGPLAMAALLAAHGGGVGGVGGPARIRLVLDTVLVAGSLFVVAWAAALAISVAAVSSPLRTFLALGYPASDLVLVSLLLALRGRPPGSGGVGTGVRVGYLVIVCCDGVFTLPGVHAGYSSGGLLDTGWFAGYLIIAAAATTGDGGRAPAPSAPPTLPTVPALSALPVSSAPLAFSALPALPVLSALSASVAGPAGRLRRGLRLARVTAPYAAAAFCLAGVLADSLDRRSDPVVLLAGTAVLVALVARQGITLLENESLAAELRAAAETLRRHAYHDPLTGLANRALLTDRLEHALAQRAAEWEPVAVMFLDLDGFKAVNDSGGHETGDRVLVEAARRIEATLRAGDTIARFGGDEFVVVLQTGTGPEGAASSARRLLAALAADYPVDGRVYRTGASIGLAFAEPGGGAADLLRRADAAMYAAKSAGKGRVHCEPVSAIWPIPHGETAPIIA